ncbi:hypothetical protein FJZ33_08075 [Candidatus Poribacteria bacterium]|nr:hypothetical protein [Candidatus Poribacteria bacterium]
MNILGKSPTNERYFDEAVKYWLKSNDYFTFGKRDPYCLHRLSSAMADVVGIKLIKDEIDVIAVEVKDKEKIGPQIINQTMKNFDFANKVYLANTYKRSFNKRVWSDAELHGVGLIWIKSKACVEDPPLLIGKNKPNPILLDIFLKKNNIIQCSICKVLVRKWDSEILSRKFFTQDSQIQRPICRECNKIFNEQYLKA